MSPPGRPKGEHPNAQHEGAPVTRPEPQARAGSAAAPAPHALESELPALRQRPMRQACLAVHDTGLAEDLVQDTLIAIVQQHEQRRGDASLTTWAVAILKNKVADWYRSPACRRMVQITAEDGQLDAAIDALYDAHGAYAESVPAWRRPDAREENRQMMKTLEPCMACLPGQTGRVFMMREWLGFETGEICERLGVSAANCRTILHRARMGLRSCMQRDGFGAGEAR